MPEKLIIPGAKIRYIDLRKMEACLVLRIHLTSDMRPRIAIELGCLSALYAPRPEDKRGPENPPIIKDGWSKMDLEGALQLDSFSLAVDGLEQHGINALGASALRDFAVHRVQGKDDSPATIELRFKLITAAEGAAALLESYVRTCGFETRGKLTVWHIEGAQQELIASGTAEGADDDPADDEDDEPGPVLATMREMGERARAK